MIKAIELFAGAGGLGLGLSQAGFDIVLANEVNTDFSQSFSQNHKKTKMLVGDIKDINFKEEISKLNTSPIDLVSGGPPCQGFSTVGAKNFDDSRNSLFYQFVRAVKEIKPNYLLFENVSGFKSLYNGVIFETLLKELDKLRYHTKFQVIDASHFGLPQVRKRTIVIGWKSGLTPVEFPKPQFTNNKLSLIDAISDLPKLGVNDSSNVYNSKPQNDYQKEMRIGVEVLTEHNSSNYGKKMQKILELVPEQGTIEDIPKSLRPKKYFKNTYARLSPNLPSPTITRNFGTPSSSRCIHPFQNRALSTREGARLQGFPDSYTFFGSKTAKNLQIGNSVPPILGKVIGKKIIESILENQKLKKPRQKNDNAFLETIL